MTSAWQRVTAVVGTSLVVTVLAGCSTGAPDQTTAGSADPVQLGLLLPLSGGSAATGEAMLAAAQLTVDDLNAAGGVLGREVELVVADDACDPQTAVEAATDVLDAGIAAAVGGACSSSVVPTLSIFDGESVPMVIPAANATDLLTPGYPGVFLISPVVTSEAQVAVPWLADLGARRVLFVHDGTSFPFTLAEQSDAVARATGAVTSLGLQEVPQGSADLTGVAAGIMASGADAVYFTGYEPDAIELAESLHTIGYPGLLMVGDGAIGDTFLQAAPRALGRSVYVTTPPLAEFGDNTQVAWAADFTARTGSEPLLYTMQAADAVAVAVDAIRRAGTDEPGAVGRAIAAGSGVPLLTGGPAFDADHVLTGVSFALLEATAGGTVAHDRRVPDPVVAP